MEVSEPLVVLGVDEPPAAHLPAVQFAGVTCHAVNEDCILIHLIQMSLIKVVLIWTRQLPYMDDLVLLVLDHDVRLHSGHHELHRDGAAARDSVAGQVGEYTKLGLETTQFRGGFK